MQRIFVTVCSVLFFMVTAPHPVDALPSDDVCCFGYEKSSSGQISTQADFMSGLDCKPGRKSSRGFTVCGSSPDKDNCTATSAKTICERCGFHWLTEAGGVCSEKTIEELAPKKK